MFWISLRGQIDTIGLLQHDRPGQNPGSFEILCLGLNCWEIDWEGLGGGWFGGGKMELFMPSW